MVFDWFPLVVGFLGSLHCLGMCGPLVLAYSLSCRTSACATPWRFGAVRQGVYQIGRIATYGALGALAAGLFKAGDLGRIFFNLRGAMSLLGGALLVLLGLALLRLIPVPALMSSPALSAGPRIRSLLQSKSLRAALMLGGLNALLPCCLSWAMIVTAATTQNPARGFLTMGLFGLGTLPALLLTGLSASWLSLRVRLWGERLAGLSVMVTGAVLLLKGAGILD